MEKNEAREIVMEATRSARAEYDEMNGMTDGKFRQLCRVGGPVIESYLAESYCSILKHASSSKDMKNHHIHLELEIEFI